MKYDDLQELISGRCSHRKFLEKPVPEEIIEKLIDCARSAPSGHNLQPWRFVAVINPEVIERMAAAVEEGLQAAVSAVPEETAKKLQDYSFFMTHFKNAPLVLVVLLGTSEYITSRISAGYGVPVRPEELVDIDLLGAGAAVQNLLLAAHSLGLGTCWMTEPVTYAGKEIEKLVSAEPGFRAVSVVAAGFPIKERNAAPKKPVSEVLRIIGNR